MEKLKPSNNFLELLDILVRLEQVRTKEFHLNIELFSSDDKYKEYNFLSDDDWFETDMSPYFEDRFIEFGGESDGSTFCLWYYPGLIGEPPVVYLGGDANFCTIAPSMSDLICLLTSCLEVPDGYETKPKDIWSKRVVDMEYLQEELPDTYEDITAFRKIVGNSINCTKYKHIMKRFKQHPKFHKWVKKVQKKENEINNQ